MNRTVALIPARAGSAAPAAHRRVSVVSRGFAPTHAISDRLGEEPGADRGTPLLVGRHYMHQRIVPERFRQGSGCGLELIRSEDFYLSSPRYDLRDVGGTCGVYSN